MPHVSELGALADERDSSSRDDTSGGHSTVVGISLADDRDTSFTGDT